MKQEGKKPEEGCVIKPTSIEGTGTGKILNSCLSYSSRPLSGHEGPGNMCTLTASTHWLRAVLETWGWCVVWKIALGWRDHIPALKG